MDRAQVRGWTYDSPRELYVVRVCGQVLRADD